MLIWLGFYNFGDIAIIQNSCHLTTLNTWTDTRHSPHKLTFCDRGEEKLPFRRQKARSGELDLMDAHLKPACCAVLFLKHTLSGQGFVLKDLAEKSTF